MGVMLRDISSMCPFEGDYDNPKGCLCISILSQVPLDYADPHGDSAAIALIRIPSPLAGTPAYRGPILFNPGGPGGSGVDLIRKAGLFFSVIVGPRFDLVGFDPRGEKNSLLFHLPHIMLHLSRGSLHDAARIIF
jgi:hypothetical protein